MDDQEKPHMSSVQCTNDELMTVCFLPQLCMHHQPFILCTKGKQKWKYIMKLFREYVTHNKIKNLFEFE